LTSLNLYELLGLTTTASAEEIKNAYKSLAKKYHPDKNPGSKWHEEQFKIINHAYQVLSDPYQKKIYDDKLAYTFFISQKQPSSKSNTLKKKKTAPPQPSVKKKSKKQYDTTFMVVGFFALVGILSYFLYLFMNQYTAKDLSKKAEVLYQKRLYDKAFFMYTEVLSFDDKNVNAYERRGSARIKAIQDYSGAIKDYTNAILYSDTPSDSIYFKRANCHLKLKNYALAISDLDSILKWNPNFDSAYFYKAEINYFIEQYEKAIPIYTIFHNRNPSSYESILKRGFCYLKNEKYNDALTDFNTIIEQVPQDGESYYYRAFTHFAMLDTLKGCNDLRYAELFGFNEATIIKKTYCP